MIYVVELNTLLFSALGIFALGCVLGRAVQGWRVHRGYDIDKPVKNYVCRWGDCNYHTTNYKALGGHVAMAHNRKKRK